MIRRKYSHLFIYLFVVGIILLGNGHHVFANPIVQDVNDTAGQAALAHDHFSTARHNYTVMWIQLEILDMERAALQVQYKSNKTTMKKEAIELAAAAAPKSVIPVDYVFNTADIAASGAKIAISASDAVDLQKKLVAKNLEIQKKLIVVANHNTTVDTTYTHYVAHINAFNKANERNGISPSANVTAAGKGYIPPEEGKDGVSVDSNLSVDCSNPKCSTSYSASVYGLGNIVTLSEGGSAGGYKGHKETCTRDHAFYTDIGSGGVRRSALLAPSGPYWNCPPNYPGCPKSANHVKKCPGTCGEYNVYPARGGSNHGNYYAMHRVECNEDTPRNIFNGWTGNCISYYFSCAGISSCRNVSNHISDDDSTENPVVSPPPTPTPTDNTPNCPDCTSHCSSPCSCSTSGTCNGTMVTAACGVHTIEPGSSSEHSHRYISSCSETENGNTCTNTSGYYACAPHSHTYPAPPPPAQTWPTCTACNASYNPNSTYHVNLHRPRECRFSGCGNSWHACSISGWSPPCNNAYRKSKGWKCGAK